MSDYVRDLLRSLVDRLCFLEAELERLSNSDSGGSTSAGESLETEVRRIHEAVFGPDDNVR